MDIAVLAILIMIYLMICIYLTTFVYISMPVLRSRFCPKKCQE